MAGDSGGTLPNFRPGKLKEETKPETNKKNRPNSSNINPRRMKMAKYRVTVLMNRDSTEYLVDKIVETKSSARAVINRFLRKHPDCYEVSVDAPDRSVYSSHQESDPLLLNS
jgi:hypothetical protein